MKTYLLRKGRELFNSPWYSRATNRRNALHWARATHRQGPKHVLSGGLVNLHAPTVLVKEGHTTQ